VGRSARARSCRTRSRSARAPPRGRHRAKRWSPPSGGSAVTTAASPTTGQRRSSASTSSSSTRNPRTLHLEGGGGGAGGGGGGGGGEGRGVAAPRCSIARAVLPDESRFRKAPRQARRCTGPARTAGGSRPATPRYPRASAGAAETNRFPGTRPARRIRWSGRARVAPRGLADRHRRPARRIRERVRGWPRSAHRGSRPRPREQLRPSGRPGRRHALAARSKTDEQGGEPASRSRAGDIPLSSSSHSPGTQFSASRGMPASIIVERSGRAAASDTAAPSATASSGRGAASGRRRTPADGRRVVTPAATVSFTSAGSRQGRRLNDDAPSAVRSTTTCGIT